MIVALAVLASLVCLVLGLTIGPFVLVYVALAVSVLGLLLLLGSMLRRRRQARRVAVADAVDEPVDSPAVEPDAAESAAAELVSADVGAADLEVAEPDVAGPDVTEPDVTEPDAAEPDVAEPAPPVVAVPSGDAVTVVDEDDATRAVGEAGPEPVAGGGPSRPDVDADVLVIPGRRRFHRDGCRLLADRASDRIALEEALEEGFTPCSTCIPDRSALGSALARS